MWWLKFFSPCRTFFSAAFLRLRSDSGKQVRNGADCIVRKMQIGLGLVGQGLATRALGGKDFGPTATLKALQYFLTMDSSRIHTHVNSMRSGRRLHPDRCFNFTCKCRTLDSTSSLAVRPEVVAASCPNVSVSMP